MNRVLLLSLLLAACGAPPAQTRAPSSGAESGRAPSTISWEDLQAQLASGECKVDRRCGALAFVNCRIEVDGPGYYVDESARKVLAICGGACMLPSEDWCVDCPPAAWTCRP